MHQRCRSLTELPKKHTFTLMNILTNTPKKKTMANVMLTRNNSTNRKHQEGVALYHTVNETVTIEIKNSLMKEFDNWNVLS